MESPIEKFQRLLRELFQFDCADLDFGIYRIMNHKRDTIERFIQETLPGTVAAKLDLEYNQKAQTTAALEEVARRVRGSFGPEAIDPDMELSTNYLQTPLGREYQQAKKQSVDTGDRIATETEIYNHLYAFFSRYYQEGDFISKRRYSRSHRYAIPYNGEEVYLHWANSDQYYIKTAEHFHDYSWKTPGGVAVRFKIQTANMEQDNVRGDKRFFLPLVGETQWDMETKTVVIPFEYRPLTAQETAKYGRQKLEDKIIAVAINDISSRLAKLPVDLAAALLSERRRNNNGPVSHLEHHLRQHARRNTSDFFIHKDLKGFLSRELDFYLKNEVLNLDEVERAGQQNAEDWFQKMRLVKSVGNKIIDFLAQVENFQKMLWEKRKFVAETHYCITVGSIASRFYPTIAANESQWTEWQELFSIAENETTLFNAEQGVADRRTALLQTHPTLVVDTKHFDQGFTDDLLASFDNLDEMTDGLLINGNSLQALNLLMARYNNQIDSIYIDPPYNTDGSKIIYKNDYEHSSWLSILENRLSVSNNMLTDGGVLCCAIDDEEMPKLRMVLNNIFDRELGVVVVRSNPSGRKTRGKFAPSHEYAIFVGREKSTPGTLPKTEEQYAAFKGKDENGHFVWTNLIRSGSNSERKNRPHMYFPIYVSNDDKMRVPKLMWDKGRNEYDVLEQLRPNEDVVFPIKDGQEMCWHRGYERVSKELTEYRVRRNDTIDIDFKKYMDMDAKPKTWWDKAEYEEPNKTKDTMWGEGKHASSIHASKTLKSLFGFKNFDFAKSVYLVKDCIIASGCRNICLDYFAGSGTTGHAIIDLNRSDGKKRKYVLIEVGHQFDDVVLPRIKKVTYSPEWKDGRPQRIPTSEEAERGPHITKYMRLESYEDALNGIEFAPRTQLTLEDKFSDYLLKYMLRWETRGSGTLLSVEKFASPFSYKLRLHADGETQIKTVDIPETFNYLLGLNVRSRRPYDDGGGRWRRRRYLVYRGETRDASGHNVAVIWRDTEGWQKEDFERDRTFVEELGLAAGADNVYINGDSLIPGAKPVEKMFRDRMFAGTGA